jgi:hypothetical protein
VYLGIYYGRNERRRCNEEFICMAKNMKKLEPNSYEGLAIPVWVVGDENQGGHNRRG